MSLKPSDHFHFVGKRSENSRYHLESMYHVLLHFTYSLSAVVCCMFYVWFVSWHCQ